MEFGPDGFDAEKFPAKYTNDGENYSPPLRWSGVPDGTVELAVTMINDSSRLSEPFVHWIVYKIPSSVDRLPEGFKHEKDPAAPLDILQGTNSLGNTGYNGPWGVAGRRMHYRFRIFALDSALLLQPGLDRKKLMDAIASHIIDEADFEATYVREYA